MNNFEGKSLDELKNILINLKLYKKLKSELGDRGKLIFNNLVNNIDFYKIEYYECISKQTALEEGILAYKNFFGESPKKEQIELISKKNLEGGIRVFKNDNLVDISFKKTSEFLK